MGMYNLLLDSETCCPRCGQTVDEIQTKELDADNMLKRYRVWYPKYESDDYRTLHSFEDVVFAASRYRDIHAAFLCGTAGCVAMSRMAQIVSMGGICMSKLGWTVRYKTCEDGKVVGPADFVDPDEIYRIFYDSPKVYTEKQIYEMFLERIEYLCEHGKDRMDAKEIKKRWDKAMSLSYQNPALAVHHLHI